MYGACVVCTYSGVHVFLDLCCVCDVYVLCVCMCVLYVCAVCFAISCWLSPRSGCSSSSAAEDGGQAVEPLAVCHAPCFCDNSVTAMKTEQVHTCKMLRTVPDM